MNAIQLFCELQRMRVRALPVSFHASADLAFEPLAHRPRKIAPHGADRAEMNRVYRERYKAKQAEAGMQRVKDRREKQRVGSQLRNASRLSRVAGGE